MFQKKIFTDVQAKLDTAVAFRNKYHAQLDEEKKKLIDEFVEFATSGKFKLLKKNINNGVRRQTLSQTILFYLGLLLYHANKPVTNH